MLYKIARKIKTDYLGGISFADRTGGLVRAMKDSRKTEKVYPIEFNQDKVLGDAQYMRRLVPDSTKKSVMYFEQGSNPTVVERHNNWYECEATLKLVCWFNYQEVDPDMYDPSYLIAEVIDTIPFNLGNFECLTAVTCTFAGQDENDGSIFSEYNYNEPETQFFKYPYDYFVLNFDIGYRVVTNCSDNGLSVLPVDPVLFEFSSGVKTFSIYGVSGKEYQTEAYDTGVLLAKTLHEYSGEAQEYTFTSATDCFFKIDYGREYLRGVNCFNQGVTGLTIPDDDNIRLEYIDLSDNAITTEQDLIDLIQHCYDTGVNGGEMDISGGTNASITDATALSNITTLVNDRNWTIGYNVAPPYAYQLNIGDLFGASWGFFKSPATGNLTPNTFSGVEITQLFGSVGLNAIVFVGNSQVGSVTAISIEYEGYGTVVHNWNGALYNNADAGLTAFLQANIGNTIGVNMS